MKPKPHASKYHNLTLRRGVIYFERVRDGKRERFSLETADWDEAAAARDLYDQEQAVAGARGESVELPTFADLAVRYLAEAAAHLAETTREDRTQLLRAEGILGQAFGASRIDEITRPLLLEWWHREVEGRGRSEHTGLNYLSALSGVLGYAVDLEFLPLNPVDTFRGTLRRRRRTKRGRAESKAGRSIRPLETVEELRAFVGASEASYTARFVNGRPRRQRRDGHVADLLQLDAGLRLGEVAGLRWRDVTFGDGPDDTHRALTIREAVARGKHEGTTKSGRERTVALSRRLRAALRAYWVAKGQPGPPERVLPRFRQRSYAERHFAKVLEAAGIVARHTPKDLRDSFASWLLTLTGNLAYVSAQLGHSDVAVTARHYARWVGVEYRDRIELATGDVPADLIATVARGIFLSEGVVTGSAEG